MITNYLLFFLISRAGIFTINSGRAMADNLDSDEREEVRNAPMDHEIPYSEHEDPPEPATRPKYEAPGQWARPTADKNITLDFIPSTVYAQIRATHTVKRVPRHHALLDASTDEERENAGRLKEVVTNKKVNTIYTEEGYEDAAYDHGGHQRNADFQEGYDKNLEKEGKSRATAAFRSSSEVNESAEEDESYPEVASGRTEKILKSQKRKTKKYDPKDILNTVWAEAVVTPVLLINKEGAKLEKDVEQELEIIALAAKTERPENFKDVARHSRNSENGLEASTSQLRRTFISNSQEVSGKGENISKISVNPSSAQPVAQALRRYEHSLENYPTYQDTTPKIYPTYQEIMATTMIHPTTINHGKVFWDYYKTQNPITRPSKSTSIEYFGESESSLENPTTEYPSSESEERIYRRKSGGSTEYSVETVESSESRSTNTTKLSPTETRYSTVTAPGVIQAILKSPQVMRAVRPPRLNSGEAVKTTTRGTRADPTTKRPTYTVIIRAPAKQCDENSDESKVQESVSKYELLRHLTNSVNPRSLNDEVMNNVSVIKPPVIPPFGQVTYTDYLRNVYGRPSQVQESSSAEESYQVSAENHGYHPYRYKSQQNYQNSPQPNRILPFFSWLSQLNPVAKLIPPNRMLPPSPMSRSQYAEYTERRIGVQLPQKELRFHISPYHSPTFQVNKGITRKFRRQSIRDDEKFLTNRKNDSMELMGEGVTAKYHGLRKKRSDNDLLNDAPIVVETIVDKEIKARFSDESDGQANSEYLENNEEGKVEIDVPEYNFSTNHKDIENPNEIDESIDTENNTKNNEKYPFYKDKQISSNSALKYVINPQQIPKKTLGGTEFYDSRDHYLKCDDINANLSELLSMNEEPTSDGQPKENLPRLQSLNDKLSCLKAKYFDKNPLDNPLFMEKRIDMPVVPIEFNVQQFKNRLSDLSSEPAAVIYSRASRKPERMDQYSRKKQIVNQSKPKSNNKPISNHRRTKKRNRARDPIRMIDPINSPYEKEIYEAVMGTIKNQAFQKLKKSQHKSVGRSRRRGKKSKVLAKPKGQNLHVEPHRPVRPPNYKHHAHRIDKGTYRRRPRVQSYSGPKRIEYYKTIRLHKRSIDPDQDSQASESENALQNFSSSRRNGAWAAPSSVITARPFDTTTQSTPKTVWTIRDFVRFSKPRQIDRYGNFRSNTATVDPRRKEPRYSNPTEAPDELLRLTTNPVRIDFPNPDDVKEENGDLTTANYQVREEVEEELTEAPAFHKLKEYLNSDLTRYTKESEETPTTQYAIETSEEEESIENTKEEGNGGEQVEKPSELSSESSSERLEEKEETSQESYSDEEKNAARMSDDEEEFERFNERPVSPAENHYDPKYADLGPRINKPAFYHPPFTPPKYERHRGKDYESLEEKKDKGESSKSSRYLFPWDENQREVSEESKEKAYQFGHYEFPWDRRERLAREREKSKIKKNDYYHRYWSDDDDQSSSETGFNFKVTHPWNKWTNPHRNDLSRRFWSSEIFNANDAKPVKFSSKYNKSSKTLETHKDIPKRITNLMKHHGVGSSISKYVPTTTVTPQIPPTSVTTVPRRQPTTPVIGTTTAAKVPRYTIRPRPFSLTQRRITRNHENQKEITSQSNSSKKKILSTTPRLSAPQNQRRSRTRMTTTRSSTSTTGGPYQHFKHPNYERPDFKSTESLTGPAKRTVEHHSRVSTEKIITKTSFPKSSPNEHKHFLSNGVDGLQKSSRIQKVSIVTKKTPEHIYRTEKIDKNGVKGTFISIIPNNMTDELSNMNEDSSMSSTSMEDPGYDLNSNIERMDSRVLKDENIPEHFLASLLLRAPPPDLKWLEPSEEAENNSDIKKSEVIYIKEPDQRLYSYVEDIK
ncbi:uncharacterized protein LOC135160338 [Diachasmimorpha longicaudata]|uniref:uncharacterized protein LOC135160338 n=1 Tax=Diachasmimorpha longicaudata TaxID=58733 RepID=UPI0030B896CD